MARPLCMCGLKLMTSVLEENAMEISSGKEKTCLNLIINADDFGYCSQRNRGISESFCKGVVSSVSLLVNGASSLEAVELAHKHGIPMGLHLNLTEGHPIGRDYETLIDSRGCFKGKMGFRDSLHSGEIHVEEIRTEIAAQVDWFLQNAGCHPTHIDGHQHVHVLPMVSRMLASVMKENNIAMTRNPAECVDHCTWIEPERKTFYQSVVQDADVACKLFEEAKICFSKHFVGLSTMGKDMTLERIQEALQDCLKNQEIDSLSGKQWVEFMVHPGYRSIEGTGGCGEGPDDFALSVDREHELEILTSQQLKQFLERGDFTLRSFQNIEI